MNKLNVLLIAVISVANTYAQKLPAVQQSPVKAPAIIKIDGQADEFGNKFQAYNPATEVSYTIANDNDRLYIVLQAESQDVIHRIVNGGMTFTVFNKDSKNNKGISFTYPVKNDRSKIMFMLKPNRLMSFDTSPAGLEASMKSNNASLTPFKYLKVTGIKDADTLSVFNEQGIEAAGKFDLEKKYNLELSIPVKLIQSEINRANVFTYQLRVNGGKFPSARDIPENAERAKTSAGVARILDIDDRNNAVLNAPTDFWGEYTLAK